LPDWTEGCHTESSAKLAG